MFSLKQSLDMELLEERQARANGLAQDGEPISAHDNTISRSHIDLFAAQGEAEMIGLTGNLRLGRGALVDRIRH